MARMEDIFPNLKGHKYANLTTFRKTGAAVSTPIWFAVANGKLYIMTSSTTGKVKRIRNNPHVRLEPSTGRGKSLGVSSEGIARVIPAEEVGLAEIARTALDQKYGFTKRVFDLFASLMGRMRDRVYLEVVPA